MGGKGKKGRVSKIKGRHQFGADTIERNTHWAKREEKTQWLKIEKLILLVWKKHQQKKKKKNGRNERMKDSDSNKKWRNEEHNAEKNVL